MKKITVVEKRPVTVTVVRLEAMGFGGCIVYQKPCPNAEALQRRIGGCLHTTVLKCALNTNSPLTSRDAGECDYTPPVQHH